MKPTRTLPTAERAAAIPRLMRAAARALPAIAAAALATATRADGDGSDAVQVCLQTDAAGFYRMTENRLAVSWDWSWEWLPRNATTATVSFSADFLDEPRTVTVTDASVTNAVIEDLFATGRDMPVGTGVVTLAFSNAAGIVHSRSHSVDVVRGAFAGVDVRHGPTNRNHWQAIEYPVVLPFDTRWFVNTATSAHLLWTDPATGETWTNSFPRATGVAVWRDAAALAKKPQRVQLYFWDLNHAVNNLYSADLDVMRGGTLLTFR